MTRCSCAVASCKHTSYNNSKLTFFRFPRNPERFMQWAQKIDRHDVKANIGGNYFVCELHFESKYIIESSPIFEKKSLTSDAVPTLDLSVEGTGASVKKKRRFPCRCQLEAIKQKHAKASTSKANTKLESSGNYSYTKRLQKIMSLKLDQYTFEKLCDKFLPNDVAQRIKEQVQVKFQYYIKLVHNDFNNKLNFYLKLYFTNPLAYELLTDKIGLPTKTDLANFYIPQFTRDRDTMFKLLAAKVDYLQHEEKICSVLIRCIPIQPYLFYNTKQDKMYGFHEVNEEQTTQIAKYAIIVIVRGIYKDWHVPVSFALISEKKFSIISPWFYSVLSRLFSVGLYVMVCISNLNPELFISTPISVFNTSFHHIGRDITFMYNPDYLMFQIKRTLMKFQLRFLGQDTNWKHLLKLYEIDSKREYKLAPKLTEDHVSPVKNKALPKNVTKHVLSKEVATAISTYMDVGQIDKSAQGTVKFISFMSKLQEFFDYVPKRNNDDHKEKLPGIHELIFVFKELKIIQDGKDVTIELPLIREILITLKSIILLDDRLNGTKETYSQVPRKFLRMDVLNKFVLKLKKANNEKKITSLSLIRAFRKKYYHEIMKPIETEKFVRQFTSFITTLFYKDKSWNFYKAGLEKKSFNALVDVNYKGFVLSERPQFLYVCGFVLEKTFQRHNECASTLKYVTFDEKNKDNYKIYLEVKESCSEKLPMIPPDSFVVFLQEFEAELQDFLTKDLLIQGRVNQLMPRIRKKTEKVKFQPPCACFPEYYLRRLYIRLRLYHLISMNNKDYKTRPTNPTFEVKRFI